MDESRGRNPRQLLKAARWLRPYRWTIAFTLLALIFGVLVQLSFGLAVRAVVDGKLLRGGIVIPRPYLFALGGVGLAYALSSYFRVYRVSWLGERVVADVRNDLFGHVIGQSPHFFETTKTADVISRLVVDTSLMQTLLVGTVPGGLQSLILLMGSAVLMAIHSLKLSLVVFALLPICALPAVRIGRRLRMLSLDAQRRLGKVGAEANESLRAVATVQAFNHEEIDRKRVAAGVEEAFKAARRRFHGEALLSAGVALLGFLILALVLWLGVRDVLAGRMSAGELTAFVIYAMVGVGSFRTLTGVWAQLQRAAGAVERVLEILRVKPEILPPANPLTLPMPSQSSIVFKEVTFRYPSRLATPALDSFSLEVMPGEVLALVGPSGAGKSTVFKLLLRFYDVESGQILFDGVDITQVAPKDLRSRIGLVSQEPDLFSATVAQNILYGRPEAEMQEVVAAAEAAAATEFIERLPEGFDSYLGEEGVRLSGGQRQRLAIARAMLRESAGVLLFDEATSALDSDSEQQIQQALTRAASQKTVMVIAHRLATVKKADRIVVMDKGRIVGIGRHEDLLRRSELYARLANLQFGTVAHVGRRAERDKVSIPKVPVVWPFRLPGWEREGSKGLDAIRAHDSEEWDIDVFPAAADSGPLEMENGVQNPGGWT